MSNISNDFIIFNEIVKYIENINDITVFEFGVASGNTLSAILDNLLLCNLRSIHAFGFDGFIGLPEEASGIDKSSDWHKGAFNIIHELKNMVQNTQAGIEYVKNRFKYYKNNNKTNIKVEVIIGMYENTLNLNTKGDGCRAMQKLVRDCHDTPRQKREHAKRAWQLFRSLVERRIIEFLPNPERAPKRMDTFVSHMQQKTVQAGGGRKLRVNVELQDDFSMDRTLSLYLLETLPLVDPQAPDYALVVLTLVESMLEDPEIILRKQLDNVKGRAVAEMKLAGIEYDERREEVEKLEHPKPSREFVYSTFNAFADKHPWVATLPN